MADRWEATAVGEFRREDVDGEARIWLGGWRFEDSNGQSAEVLRPDPDDEDPAPNAVIPVADVDSAVLFGWTLAELEQAATE